MYKKGDVLLANLFCISDLHLSFGADKPMDVFHGWENYTDRIKANWNRVVKPDDTVVLIGDTSWSIGTENALPDFKFIHSLPGKKIFLKGNHDYWWTTANKIKGFFKENGFNEMEILHNNFHTNGKIALCGTRGWLYDGAKANEKVVLRECGRLETSIKGAVENGLEPIVFLHYPPAYGEFVCEEIVDVLNKYNIKTLYYGHIHGSGYNHSLKNIGDISMKLVSCDCIDFTPHYITEY